MSLQDTVRAYDKHYRHIFTELCTRHIARKTIAPGDTVFDLGANVGFHSTDFSNCVGETGKVHMFEPNPDLWVGLLKIPNSRLWPFAVGDINSVENFYLPIGHDQVGSLVDARDFMGPVPTVILSVAQVKLDSLEELGQNRVSFIKIDIERREANALRGMKNFLLKDRPVIVFENNTVHTENVLAEVNYEVIPILRDFGHDISLVNVMALPSEVVSQYKEFLPPLEEIEQIMDRVEKMLGHLRV